MMPRRPVPLRWSWPGKSAWYAVHRWTGLPVWLFLSFVCLTGTAATLSQEILWLIDPAVRAAAAEDRPPVPLSQVVATLEAQAPGAHLGSIHFEEGMALRVDLVQPDGGAAVAWVDPWSGTVRRLSAAPNLPDLLRALHGWLLTSWEEGTAVGWYAVTLLSLPMLVSLLSGMVLYPRFWRLLIRPVLRLGQGARLAWGDAHRLAGAWTLWFGGIIALSSLWFLSATLLANAGVTVWAPPPELAETEVPRLAPGAPAPRPDLDAILAAARREHPGALPLSLILPEHAFAPALVTLRGGLTLLTEDVWINPYSAIPLARPPAPRTERLHTLTELAASLHFGNFAGLPLKLVWFVCGALLSGLVISGMVIWLKRTRPRAIGPRRHLPVQLSALLLLLPLTALPGYLDTAAGRMPDARALPERAIGPWRVVLAEVRPGPARPAAEGRLDKDYAVRFRDGDAERIRAAYLTVDDAETERAILHGPPTRLIAHLRFPRPAPGTEARLWLTVEGWDGSRHRISWPLAETLSP